MIDSNSQVQGCDAPEQMGPGGPLHPAGHQGLGPVCLPPPCVMWDVPTCTPLASVPGTLCALRSWPGALVLLAELPNLTLVFRNKARI